MNTKIHQFIDQCIDETQRDIRQSRKLARDFLDRSKASDGAGKYGLGLTFLSVHESFVSGLKVEIRTLKMLRKMKAVAEGKKP